jgi:hypothetical protein
MTEYEFLKEFQKRERSRGTLKESNYIYSQNQPVKLTVRIDESQHGHLDRWSHHSHNRRGDYGSRLDRARLEQLL